MIPDKLNKKLKAAAQGIDVRLEIKTLPEHTDNSKFTTFQTWCSQLSNTISYTTWGMTISYTMWEIYGHTTDIGVKKAIFSWWLSQQPAPIEG